MVHPNTAETVDITIVYQVTGPHFIICLILLSLLSWDTFFHLFLDDFQLRPWLISPVGILYSINYCKWNLNMLPSSSKALRVTLPVLLIWLIPLKWARKKLCHCDLPAMRPWPPRCGLIRCKNSTNSSAFCVMWNLHLIWLYFVLRPEKM